MIKALQNSLGTIVVDPDELKAMANNCYHTLYASEGVQGMEEVLNHVPRRVADEMNTG